MNRFCGAEDIKNIKSASDYQDRSFGKNWGMLIEELKILARGVFVLDASGKVVYAELVKEVGQEPNYDAAHEGAQGIAVRRLPEPTGARAVRASCDCWFSSRLCVAPKSWAHDYGGGALFRAKARGLIYSPAAPEARQEFAHLAGRVRVSRAARLLDAISQHGAGFVVALQPRQLLARP